VSSVVEGKAVGGAKGRGLPVQSVRLLLLLTAEVYRIQKKAGCGKRMRIAGEERPADDEDNLPFARRKKMISPKRRKPVL